MSGAGSMGGRRGKIVVFVAVALGLVSALLVYVFLSGSGDEEEVTTTGTTQPVVIAADDIGAGEHITSDRIKLRSVSASAVHPNAYTDAEDVLDKVARFPIAADEQILSNKVTSSYLATTEDGDVPLTYIVPEEKRGMAVNVEQVVSAGGLVLPGDFVDVIMIATMKTELPAPLDEIDYAMTILQNVEVLAIDQDITEVVPEDSAEDGNGEGGATEDGTEAASQRVPVDQPDPNPEAITATLAVTPDQAQRLALADEKAILRLSLRPFGDDEQQSVLGVTEMDVSSLPLQTDIWDFLRQMAPDIKELNELAGQ